MWYEIIDLSQIDAQPETESSATAISAKVRVSQSSPWFKGHFPGQPILPGIAQLGMVYDLIRQRMERSGDLMEISRVRFKKPVFPGEKLKIEVTPKEDNSGKYTFRIHKEAELISTGILTFN